MLPDNIKKEIIGRLKPLNLEKVILFGSSAWGDFHKDSDIDLYVVTKDDFLPKNWREKGKVHLRVINALDDVQKSVPIDLIVHTKPMHEKFIEINSMFCRKILKEGISLI